MRRLLPSVALVLAVCAGYPAIASAVPIDPVIGVRGGGGSEPSDSNEFFQMESCTVGSYTTDTFCLEYFIVQDVDEITSMTFQFRDASALIPNTVLFPDGLFNGFEGFLRLEDGISVQLFSGEFSSLICGFEGEVPVPCAQGSTVQVYLTVPPGDPGGPPNPPYFVSLRAVNDITVPEPGLLVLVGIGLMMAARRLRRRRSTA
jgi:hypothetical protein